MFYSSEVSAQQAFKTAPVEERKGPVTVEEANTAQRNGAKKHSGAPAETDFFFKELMGFIFMIFGYHLL